MTDRNDMKKIFTVDDLMVAVIAALGYGFGYSLAKRCGWPEAVCVAACLALGMALEEATGRIIFSKAIQRKRANRVLAYAVVLLIFVAAHAVSVRWLGESMLETVQEEVIYTVGFAVLGLIVNLFLRWIRAKRIRERYGDGEEGFVFDLTQEDQAETDKQNQRIHGEYDRARDLQELPGRGNARKYCPAFDCAWGAIPSGQREVARDDRSEHVAE